MTQDDKRTAMWTAVVTAGLLVVVLALWATGVLEMSGV